LVRQVIFSKSTAHSDKHGCLFLIAHQFQVINIVVSIIH